MKQKVYLLLVTALIIMSSCGKDVPFKTKGDIPAKEETDVIRESDEAKPDAEVIYAQIDGEVINPGVYEVIAGDRVFTLVEKAGGLMEDALISSINMAAVVEDGVSYHVLSKDAVSKDGKGGMININTADVDELTTLQGIGKSKASAIVKYREENGAFKSIEDLLNVPGIKESTLAKIRDKIIV